MSCSQLKENSFSVVVIVGNQGVINNISKNFIICSAVSVGLNLCYCPNFNHLFWENKRNVVLVLKEIILILFSLIGKFVDYGVTQLAMNECLKRTKMGSITFEWIIFLFFRISLTKSSSEKHVTSDMCTAYHFVMHFVGVLWRCRHSLARQPH